MKRIRRWFFTQEKIKWYIPAALLLPAVLYVPGVIGKIPFPSDTTEFTDLLITHYPYALILRKALFEQHVLPLWSSLIYSGGPFASNPLSGLFYLPGWLALLFPLPNGISFVIVLHVIFGTYGFFRFLRKDGLGELASLVGAWAFGLMPKMAAHYGAGHVSLIYAISWTPWLFIAWKEEARGWVVGAVAGMLFLADPRWAVYAGSFWLTYIIAYRQYQWKEMILRLLRIGLAALLVAAPLILPLIEFSSLSTRSLLTSQDIFSNSLPTEMLIGLIIPGTGGNIEWAIYLGGVSLTLFVVSFGIKKLRLHNAFWYSWFFVGLLLSLGTFGLSANWITKVPLLSMLRVPARFFILSGISIAVISARTLHVIEQVELNVKLIRITLVFLILFSVLMISGLAISGNWYGFIPVWGFIILAVSSILLLLFIANKDRKLLILGLAVLLAIDLSLISQSFYTMKDIEELDYPYMTVESISSGRNGDYRIYSPSYAIPQHLAALNDLELADGVDPMQLFVYRSFMEVATDVSGSGYSVSIPEFKTGNPFMDNRNASPDLRRLSALNVKYIVSHFELADPGLQYLGYDDDLYHYLNPIWLPRAWIEQSRSLDSIPKPDQIKPAVILSHKPNSVLVRADGPGTLVLSEVNYPGWSATVDGEAATILPAYQVLRSVPLEEGSHEINFSFHPTTVYIGMVLAGGFWLNAVLSVIRKML